MYIYLKYYLFAASSVDRQVLNMDFNDMGHSIRPGSSTRLITPRLQRWARLFYFVLPLLTSSLSSITVFLADVLVGPLINLWSTHTFILHTIAHYEVSRGKLFKYMYYFVINCKRVGSDLIVAITCKAISYYTLDVKIDNVFIKCY